MEKSLVCITAYSNKFWKIKAQGNFFIVSYGRIGTCGSINTKEFPSEAQCLKEANRLIESKLKKGYRESEQQVEEVSESTMTADQFWALLETAHRRGNDWEEQLEWLVGKLAKKPVHEIIGFDFHFTQQYSKSCTSDLWAAAFIVMGGCSDDSFDYFRAWLLFFGKEPYEQALNNPESILPYLEEMEEDVPEFEDFLYCASLAFEEKTGLDQDESLDLHWKVSGDEYVQPEMEFDWSEDDEEGLKKKFSLLWNVYGETPLS